MWYAVNSSARKAATLQEELLAAQEALAAAVFKTQGPHQGSSKDFESLKAAHSELQACHSELLAKSSDVRHRAELAARLL